MGAAWLQLCTQLAIVARWLTFASARCPITNHFARAPDHQHSARHQVLQQAIQALLALRPQDLQLLQGLLQLLQDLPLLQNMAPNLQGPHLVLVLGVQHMDILHLLLDTHLFLVLLLALLDQPGVQRADLLPHPLLDPLDLSLHLVMALDLQRLQVLVHRGGSHRIRMSGQTQESGALIRTLPAATIVEGRSSFQP